MKKIVLVTTTLILLCGMIISGCAAPPPTPSPTPTPAPVPQPVKAIELKLAHHNPEKSRVHENFLVPWCKKIEDATKGRVKITIYPNQTLAKSAEVIEATKSGVCDITWQTHGTFPGRFNVNSVTSLPFMNLASGNAGGKKLSAGAVNSRMFWELYEKFPALQAEYQDLKVLLLHTSDAYWLTTSKKPVRNSDDVKGLKLREIGGPPTDMWKALGAAPVNIPFPGVYEAADKGVIDAANMLWSGFGSFKLYEVFKYRTNAATTTAGFFLLMNKDKWNSLPPDIQKIFDTIGGLNGAEFAGEACFGFDAEKEIRDQMEKAGRKLEEVNLDAGVYDQWKAIAGKPIWSQWVTDVSAKGAPGQAILDEALKLLDKYK